MPKVWNKRDPNTPKSASYVGRPSKYGNPYPIGEERTREEVLTMYGNWLGKCGITIAEIKRDLKGRDLVCWCAPAPCHADILLKIANEDDDAQP